MTGKAEYAMTVSDQELAANALRIYRQRCGVRGVKPDSVKLELDRSLPTEAFRIEDGPCIYAGSAPAFIYGVGKLLRSGGRWRGVSTPAKKYRIIYCASHFRNFYQMAPREVLQEYLEDFALWGYNHIALRFGFMEYGKSDTKRLERDSARLRGLFGHATRVGLRKSVIVCTNEGFADTREELRATPTGRMHIGCEVCPSKPGSLDLIMDNHRSQIHYLGVPDMVILWSYDAGGCGCQQCAPYGANAMFDTAREAARLYKEANPACTIVYSTWLFDHLPEMRDDQPEWSGFHKRLENGEGDWVDCVMADSHDDFPTWPQEHGVAGKDMLNFPEISMWGRYPWGGFGANPLPARFARLWGQVASLAQGGMPYSEGNFEDFDKALYGGFYWTGANDWNTIFEEYCAYEFGCSTFGELRKAVMILEQNHPGTLWVPITQGENNWVTRRFAKRGTLKTKALYYDAATRYPDADVAWDIVRKIDSDLPEWGRTSWRWRLLYLRAKCDYLLELTHGEPNAECEEILEELTQLYCLDPADACNATAPYTDDFLKNRPLQVQCKKN